ncbi:MAG: response regulator [Chloroflexi bacterium]|nr:response regulator [Chloroflexota bacterium]
MTKPLALIVEDNEDQNLVFTTALDQAGYQVESIFDGAVAVTRLKEVVPDMIVLDLHLPNTDGGTILNQIRTDPRLSATRVILATADSAFASGLQFQAELVLLKPVSFAQLKQLAGRFLHPSKEADDS